MIDSSKRKTLKAMAVTSAAVAVGGVSSALASSDRPGSYGQGTADYSSSALPNSGQIPGLGQIEVSTRVAPTSNEIEVVLTNTAREDVTITHMTPRAARVARGEFNFAALLKDGPLRLKAGEHVTVPLDHKMISASAGSLRDVLKKSMSVITEANSFASVSIVNSAAIV